jgi:hypothetical protein
MARSNNRRTDTSITSATLYHTPEETIAGCRILRWDTTPLDDGSVIAIPQVGGLHQRREELAQLADETARPQLSQTLRFTLSVLRVV